MDIIEKHFYFIKDDYYTFANDHLLMKNKEDGVKRPCFLAALNDDGIIWMIPVTSRYTKFENLYNKKVTEHGSCDTIVLGNLLGRDCAFLIQNMFPITQKYIEGEYIQSSNGVPVMVAEPVSHDLIEKVKKVLALVRQGNDKVVFPNILEIEKKLKENL